MPEQLSMQDILSDKPAEKPAATEAPAEPPKDTKDPVEKQTAERHKGLRERHRDVEQAAQGRVRDPETGQYVKAEEKPAEKAEPEKVEAKATEPPPAPPAKPAAPPPQEFTEKEKAFLRAAQEERGKRQALEAEIAKLRGAPPAPGEAAKTFWDAPEDALAKHEAAMQKLAMNSRLQTAELIARQRHTDFDEKIAVFTKVLEQTPGLHTQWLASPDPAEFAYSLGKNHMELQEAGSLDGLRAKIEKETRIKLEAELREKADALAKERAALPPSLSEAPSKGPNKPVWGGIPSMDEILGKS